ncbi:Lrp/AsnC ligand binding domain-containing protein [Streptomyces sp. NPDC048172]|uniref:Lrp/AsnC ligand binding domain-containing protein n=1 Tax=Streptomyces sp. NPDC048172 TaxID=3365505 RepID=UPI0037186B15
MSDQTLSQPDWSITGEGNPWHVRLTAEPGRADELARRTAALPEAQLVATTAGRTDIYAVVQPGTRGAVRELLTARLPSMPGVGSARSELVLRALTRTDSWRVPRLAAEHLEEVGEPPSAAGRAPAAKIARELGVAQSTAYRTARQLLRDGVVRPRVEIEPALLGYALEAVVTLTLAPGDTEHAAEVLARHPSARYVSLAALPGISAVVVLPVLDVLRRNWLDRHDGLLRGPSGG